MRSLRRSENYSADDRPDHGDGGEIGFFGDAEPVIALEECGIEILRSVGGEVHHRHQGDEVEEDRPMSQSVRGRDSRQESALFFCQTSDSVTPSRTKMASSAGKPPMKNSGRQP